MDINKVNQTNLNTTPQAHVQADKPKDTEFQRELGRDALGAGTVGRSMIPKPVTVEDIYSRLEKLGVDEKTLTKAKEILSQAKEHGALSIINKMNDNVLKFFCESATPNSGSSINKDLVEKLNSVHTEFVNEAVFRTTNRLGFFSNEALLKGLKGYAAITDEMYERNKDNKEALRSVTWENFGLKDLIEKTDRETYAQISKDTVFEISKQDAVHTTPEHIKSAVEYFKTPEYKTLAETLKSKCPNVDDSFESVLQAYLISKTTNPEDIIKYAQNLDINKLCDIAPRVKDFKPTQMMEFLFHHSERNTELTEENLTYQGSLAHDMEKELVGKNRLTKTLSIFPNTDRRIGHMPSEWIDGIPKEQQKEFVTNLNKLFKEFAQTMKDYNLDDFREESGYIQNIEPKLLMLKKELDKLFNSNVIVEGLGSGEYGAGIIIAVENKLPYVLKIFRNQDLTYGANKNGKSAEPQNAMFAQSRADNFAKFYFGNLADSIDNDGFMVNEFLSEDNLKGKANHLKIETLSSSDSSKSAGHNYIGEQLIDYGEMFAPEQELIENPAIARFTRIITDNLVQPKGSELYGFNEKRLSIVKDALKKAKNPQDVLKAIAIIEKYAGDKLQPEALESLKSFSN